MFACMKLLKQWDNLLFSLYSNINCTLPVCFVSIDENNTFRHIRIWFPTHSDTNLYTTLYEQIWVLLLLRTHAQYIITWCLIYSNIARASIISLNEIYSNDTLSAWLVFGIRKCCEYSINLYQLIDTWNIITNKSSNWSLVDKFRDLKLRVRLP